jgi:hypothetical protein
MENIDGEPLATESVRMLEYLRERAAALGPAEIRGRVRAAMKEMDAAVAGLDEGEARAHPVRGEWSIAQVVDHLAQTQIRSAEELRHLLNGRRPPGPPVYDAIMSGAGTWAPWPELLDGLRAANEEMDAVLATGSHPAPDASPTVRSILLANHTDADGRITAETFVAELDWREYALVQRLHLLDHRTQVKKLRRLVSGSFRPPVTPR